MSKTPESLLPSWLEVRPQGLYCLPGDFYLDPSALVDRAVVSHAHADHYRRGLDAVWCTPETAALAKARYKRAAGKSVHRIKMRESFSMGPVTVEFLPAGHILGSAQILMSYQGVNVLFSGDFHLSPNVTCEPLVYPQVPIDLLICESTFGEKGTHPEAGQHIRELVAAAGTRPLLIGTYVLGKAQHLHSLFHQEFPDMPVFLYPEILKFHRVYAEFGKMDLPIIPWRRQLARKTSPPYVYLIPPRMLSSYKNDHQWFKLFASGWDRRKELFFLDEHLEISDHASADEIMTYIRTLAPQKVAFHHGYPESLIEACKMLKIQSYPLPLPSTS